MLINLLQLVKHLKSYRKIKTKNPVIASNMNHINNIFLLVIILVAFNANAQGACKGGDNGKLHLEIKFKADVENNNVKLYILGGFVPAVTEADRKFEEKYKVRFYDFGCTPPPLDYYKEYNTMTFAYLKEKYGDAWQQEIRPNILGWDGWKSQK